MNLRLASGSLLVLWAGATLVLSTLRVVNRRTLADRLGPYAPHEQARPSSPGIFSVGSFRDAVQPLARAAGDRFAHLLGVGEDMAVRLERCHSPIDATEFRVRQLGWATIAFCAGTVISLGLRLPSAMGALFVLGAPALAFLIVEQRLAVQSAHWQERLLLELPVVAEQLGMLLSAGYSVGAALSRIAGRGHGACSRDLTKVCGRIRHGLGEVEALREWARVADVEAVDRLVAVLALNREAGDLGRLIAEEARAIRREVHRRLVETIERRSQQVWIPVTVATLVPGVVFLAIPFIEAMRLFAGS